MTIDNEADERSHRTTYRRSGCCTGNLSRGKSHDMTVLDGAQGNELPGDHDHAAAAMVRHIAAAVFPAAVVAGDVVAHIGVRCAEPEGIPALRRPLVQVVGFVPVRVGVVDRVVPRISVAVGPQARQGRIKIVRRQEAAEAGVEEAGVEEDEPGLVVVALADEAARDG
ncbi:MAG: hypothetical protein M3453_04675 [Pseudomonadota bacterium]|nr:hypothetical protein [Pseudomonadota bacterium]